MPWSATAYQVVQDLLPTAAASPRLQIAAARAQAELAHWQGDLQKAVAHLASALALAEQIGLPGEQWSIFSSLTRCYEALGEQTNAYQTRTNAAVLRRHLGL